jgi:hypothetical protein
LAIGSDLWTESPLAAGQGTVSIDYDLGLLSGGVKAILASAHFPKSTLRCREAFLQTSESHS